MSNTKGNSLWKVLGVLFLGIAGIWLIYTLIFEGGIGGGHMYMGTGAGIGALGTISVLLLFLIKVLFAFFVIVLVIGIAVAVKNTLFTEEDIRRMKGTFTRDKSIVCKEQCDNCGKEQEEEWKVCPYCGTEKELKIE